MKATDTNNVLPAAAKLIACPEPLKIADAANELVHSLASAYGAYKGDHYEIQHTPGPDVLFHDFCCWMRQACYAYGELTGRLRDVGIDWTTPRLGELLQSIHDDLPRVWSDPPAVLSVLELARKFRDELASAFANRGGAA